MSDIEEIECEYCGKRINRSKVATDWAYCHNCEKYVKVEQ